MNTLKFYKTGETITATNHLFEFNNNITGTQNVNLNNNITILSSPLGFLDSQSGGKNHKIILSLQKIKTSDYNLFVSLLFQHNDNLKVSYKVNGFDGKSPLRHEPDSIVQIENINTSKYEFSNDWEDPFLDFSISITPLNPILY